MPASDKTNEKRPVIITTNVLFKTVRRALLRVILCKRPCTAVLFRLWYVRGLCAVAPLPGRFISHVILRERCNEVRRIVKYSDDFSLFWRNFCERVCITQQTVKYFDDFAQLPCPL